MSLPALADQPAPSGELPTSEPAAVGMSAERLALVDARVEELIAKNRIAGASVVVTRRGQVVYDKRFGLRDREAKLPMEEDTIFRIFSMTKSMTSALALMLHEEGTLSLDDPIARHFPAFEAVRVWKDGKAAEPTRPPTVRDLLRHTSGWSYGASGVEAADTAYAKADPFGREKTLAEMAAAMATVPLAFEPGSRWMYGVSTDLLGAVTEAAADTPFDQLLEKRLFAPLDLRDTSFVLDQAEADRLARVYQSNHCGALAHARDFDDFRLTEQSKLPSGGGGLLSTMRDYTRFLQMIANGGELLGQRLLKPESVRLMTTNQLSDDAMPVTFGPLKRHGTGFGLGFSVKVGDTNWNPHAPRGEYGWGGLLSTHYWASPKDELVVVTMEQTIPYDFLLENELKPLTYDAIED